MRFVRSQKVPIVNTVWNVRKFKVKRLFKFRTRPFAREHSHVLQSRDKPNLVLRRYRLDFMIRRKDGLHFAIERGNVWRVEFDV